MSETSGGQGAAARRRQIDQHPRPRVTEPAVPAAAAEEAVRARPRRPSCPPLPECRPTRIKRKGANGDEGRYGKTYIGNFHKGLPHDPFGEVNKAAYKKLVKILDTGKDFDDIPLDLGRLMVNPQAGLATDVEGPNPKSLKILRAPRLDSAEAAAEAVELYWMALLRDVRFTDFAGDADVAAAAAEISGLKDFTGPREGGQVTPQTIFRGCFHGDVDGPYLSQFLLHPIPYGSLTIDQRQQTVPAGVDYLTDFPTWLQIQNGAVPGPEPTAPPRYIQTMRDLAHYVHVDALYEAYLNACLILLGHGAPLDPGNPYLPPNPNAKTQIGFGTFGGPHVLSLVCEVATRALKAVWWQKWFVHRRLRPEAYGGLVHVKLEGVNGQTKNYPLHKQVLDSDAVARTHSAHGSYLLPMAFPEGSPTHPSYGAGHATVAGACVTVLKAFFDDLAPLPASLPAKVPNAAGDGLVAYTGPGAQTLTVGGELDKVAANISIGRNMAGVHWRSDYTESVRLGERVALHILSKQRKDYHEKDWSFSLCTFDGKRVRVDRDGVHGA